MLRITSILFIFILISTVLAAEDSSELDCSVSFILPTGTVCINEKLNTNKAQAQMQGMTTCNDIVSQIDAEGNCQRCWITLYENYSFGGESFTYNLAATKYLNLAEYDFVTSDGKISNTWDRMVSSYKIKCAVGFSKESKLKKDGLYSGLTWASI